MGLSHKAFICFCDSPFAIFYCIWFVVLGEYIILDTKKGRTFPLAGIPVKKMDTSYVWLCHNRKRKQVYVLPALLYFMM